MTCEDVVFMKNVDRSSEYPKKKRWSPKDEGKKFYLPHNAVCTQYFTFRTNPTLALQLENKKISIVLCVFQVLQTDAYAGKMWMMGGQGNKLSRSDGIDMSLGLITTPNDLKQLKAKRKTMLGTGI